MVAEDGRYGRKSKVAKEYRDEFAERGHVVDAQLFESRFAPPVPHTPMSRNPEEYKTHRLTIEGVVVRIKEDWDEIAVTVEGHLDRGTVAILQQFGRDT